MDCVFFNNILIQILRFAYFPVTNSKEKIRFIGTLMGTGLISLTISF